MPSAVIASAAPPTLAVAVAAESVLEHAEATRMAAVPSKAANRGRWVIVFTGFTREGETSRLADLLTRTVHRIGRMKYRGPNWARTRDGPHGPCHTREIENVVARSTRLLRNTELEW